MSPDLLWPLVVMAALLLVVSLLPLLMRTPPPKPGAGRDAYLVVRSTDRTVSGVPVFVVTLNHFVPQHPPELAVLQFQHEARVLRYIPESGVPQVLADYDQVHELQLLIRELPGEERLSFVTLVVQQRDPLRISHAERMTPADLDELREQLQRLSAASGLRVSEAIE